MWQAATRPSLQRNFHFQFPSQDRSLQHFPLLHRGAPWALLYVSVCPHPQNSSPALLQSTGMPMAVHCASAVGTARPFQYQRHCSFYFACIPVQHPFGLPHSLFCYGNAMPEGVYRRIRHPHTQRQPKAAQNEGNAGLGAADHYQQHASQQLLRDSSPPQVFALVGLKELKDTAST